MANNSNMIPIPGRLHSVATDGQVAGANEIHDDAQNKNQSTINSELINAVGTGGSVDSRIAAAVNVEKTRAEGAEEALDGRVDTLEDAVGTGGSVDSRISSAVATETTRAQAAEGALQQLYENLTQSDIVVVSDHTAVSNPSVNVIYREQGTTSYSDWMYYNNAWQKMAEYDNAIDDEPTAGSNNLVKSGGVKSELNDISNEISIINGYSLIYKGARSIDSNNWNILVRTNNINAGDKVLVRVKAQNNFTRNEFVLGVLNKLCTQIIAPSVTVDNSYDLTQGYQAEFTIETTTSEPSVAIYHSSSSAQVLEYEVYMQPKSYKDSIVDGVDSLYYKLIGHRTYRNLVTGEFVKALAISGLKAGDEIVYKVTSTNAAGNIYTKITEKESDTTASIGWYGASQKKDLVGGDIITRDISYCYLQIFCEGAAFGISDISIYKKTIIEDTEEYDEESAIFETDQILEGMTKEMPFLKGLSMATRVTWTLAQWKSLVDILSENGLNFLLYFDFITFSNPKFTFKGEEFTFKSFDVSLSESDFVELVEYCQSKNVEIGFTGNYFEWYDIPTGMRIMPNVDAVDFTNETAREFYLAVIENLVSRMSALGIKYFNLSLDEYKGTATFWTGLLDAGAWGYETFINKATQIIEEHHMIPMCFNGSQCAGGKSYPNFCKQMVILHYLGSPSVIPTYVCSLDTLLDNGYHNLVNSSWELYYSPYDGAYPSIQTIENFNIRKFHQDQFCGIMPKGVLMCAWPAVDSGHTAQDYINGLTPLLVALGERLDEVLSDDRPSSPTVGQQHFDTALMMPIWWNGDIWIDSNGNKV